MADDLSTKPFGKHPATIIREAEPLNAGPPLPLLRETFVTPTERFFVRNHGPVPTVDEATYRLHITGLVNSPLSLTLEHLRTRFAAASLMATLQCAGNRRQDLIDVQPIPGELPWGEEAVGNATWRGVRLRDVLQHVGVQSEAAHVAFVGADTVERHGQQFGFGGSIPLDKALHPDTLLAYEMNGEPLTPVHGAPLRVVVPGYLGARSVKWLRSIKLQAEPSDNYFQRRAYRLYPSQMNHENVDWDSGMMLGELSLNSVICEPQQGETLATEAVVVRGYATAGGGRTVQRVDVSADGGESWQQATIEPCGEPWAWRFWETTLNLPAGEHELMVRCIDSAANVQPATADTIWNFKGYMSNAWHRVHITIHHPQEDSIP